VFQKIKLILAGLDSPLKSFYNCRQGKEENMETYHRRFEAAAATIIMSKGNLSEHERLTKYETKKGIGKSGVTDIEKLVEDKFLGAAFLQNADPGRFTNLWRELKNSMLKGHDDYPKSLRAAYEPPL